MPSEGEVSAQGVSAEGEVVCLPGAGGGVCLGHRMTDRQV